MKTVSSPVEISTVSPLAISYDFLGIALAELGNISERRVAQLIMGLRGLPEFLVANPGLTPVL